MSFQINLGSQCSQMSSTETSCVVGFFSGPNLLQLLQHGFCCKGPHKLSFLLLTSHQHGAEQIMAELSFLGELF